MFQLPNLSFKFDANQPKLPLSQEVQLDLYHIDLN
jgi:hypothetical protein